MTPQVRLLCLLLQLQSTSITNYKRRKQQQIKCYETSLLELNNDHQTILKYTWNYFHGVKNIVQQCMCNTSDNITNYFDASARQYSWSRAKFFFSFLIILFIQVFIYIFIERLFDTFQEALGTSDKARATGRFSAVRVQSAGRGGATGRDARQRQRHAASYART